MGNIEALASCYRRLDIRLNNLDNRKIMQKKIYFLQEFGFDFGYNFGFYIYGPYSAELTSDAFRLDEQFDVARRTITRQRLDSEHRRLLNQLNILIRDIPSNELADRLELLSSIHFLNNHIFEPIDNLEDMVTEIRKRKPDRFRRNEIENAWNRLEENDLIT